MASMVAKASSSSCSSPVPLVSVHEKGSRNKRKFRADPPSADPHKIIPSNQNECSGYEFSAEKFEAALVHGPSSVCELCGVNEDYTEGLKLDLGLSSALGLSEVRTSQPREELETDESHDADWSDLTESQLEELVLSNLDAIFKSAIKKIVACGYTEEVATKAVLRSGVCYGCKDTVSNIVDSSIAFLRNGQGIHPSRDHCFEDLQQLEKYILAESVCVLREVRPFFSIGDAMWCLLICDMNVSHACAMDGDSPSFFPSDGASNGTPSTSTQSQLKTEINSSELNLPNSCKLEPSVSYSQPEPPSSVTRVPNVMTPKNSDVLSGLISEKDGSKSTSNSADKSLGSAGTSQSVIEEKLISTRKVHSSSTKREYMLRHKSLHLEKSYRTYGPKGSRAGKLSGSSGLILDKQLKPVSDSADDIKNASLRLSKVIGNDVFQENVNQNLLRNPSSPASFDFETSSTTSVLKTNNQSALPVVTIPPVSPAVNIPPVLSATDTELSLSFPAKSKSTSVLGDDNAEEPNCNFSGIQYEKSLAQWVTRDKKDEMFIKLVPRVQELQNQLQEWTDWANQKVMQAARRLSKDRAELKSLRQEREEVERLKREKQTMEENTMKKLTEMENALCKASGQVERANSTLRKLEVENAALRQEMEAAKLNAAESAASCKEVSKREKSTLMKFQSWEKQKMILQEELATEKRKVLQLRRNLELAKQFQEHHEVRWQQEKSANEKLFLQAHLIRKEREQIEDSTKCKEDTIRLNTETNLQKYKDDILKLEKEIAQLRLKTDSSKIEALRRGINESHHRSRLADSNNIPQQESSPLDFSKVVADIHQDYSETSGVKRERECVMCLSEEMSVVFLPCAHQVVCTTCNELHEKQGMNECPSCRSSIQRRISVRYACT